MSRSSAAASPAARRRCICAGAAPRSSCSSAASAAARRAASITAPVVETACDGTQFYLRTADGLELRAANLVNVAGAWGHEVAARFGESVPEAVIAPNMCVSEPLPYFMVPNFGVCGGGGVYVRQI